MVSSIPFDKIPRFDVESLRRNRGKFLLFIAYLVIILGLREYGLVIVFFIFISKGLIVGGARFWREAFEEIDDNKERRSV